MLHPFQSILLNGDGTLLFGVIKNELLAFKKISNEYVKCGSWVDELDKTPLIKEKVLKEQQRQLAENAQKKLKTNEGEPVDQPRKEAKVPTPGPGAPPVYQYIRNLSFSRDEKMLIVCTDSDKAAVIFSINLANNENILTLIKRQQYPKRPNAVTTSVDDKELIVADKFGDVYVNPISESATTLVNDEQPPVLGHVSMLTDVAIAKGSDGKQYLFTSDRDEHIKISHYPQSFIVNKWLFGHEEYISTLALPEWNSRWLLSAGGDPFIFLWDWESGALLSKFDYSTHVKTYLNDKHFAPDRFQNENGGVIEFGVAKIVPLAFEPYVLFFVEATRVIFVLNVDLESGKLSLHQTLEFDANVVALTSAKKLNKLCVSLDSGNLSEKDMLKFISFNDGLFADDAEENTSFNKSIRESLSEDAIANVELKDVYPLYHTAQLRKRGEHYS